ncbi:MAG: ABC-type nitrate/sulfonate/bicarbonate transport system, permease component [Halonotius sp. J07HN6]|jgi:ABC-type nitrate/sulfonate/bicarbonate transport system, permease component|nr:MAG: ABC-type nitrate/sulfonate/bicarbonate transport system, permease component [Halonotius sp. J07HN6]ERH05686.1 MAG: ABC-type nitrate/sulfonate/bicarbonate transport system, permease component [Halonotius sp. J07HN4]
MSIDTTTESESGLFADEELLESGRRQRLLRGTIGTAVFLLIWQVSATPVPTYLLPTPLEVAQAFVVELTAPTTFILPLLGTEVTLTRMIVGLINSLYHYIPGLFVGGAAGIAFGIALGWSQLLDDAITPVQRVLRPIPPLAWIAFAIVWLGVNHQGAAFIVGIGAFWINFYNAYAGVKSVPQSTKEVAASLGVESDLTMIRKVIVPKASPEIMTGIRTSIGQSWMIVVAAELFGAPGVGFQIINAAQNLALDVSVAYMFVISIVFLISDGIFQRVESRVLVWRE